MAGKAKIGIIGGGGILQAHMSGYTRAEESCEVVAVASLDPSRDEVIRSLVGPNTRIVRDHHEILHDTDIQGVDILLPHHLHMPVTLEAANAGKHVLVEKVMARNIEECDRMIAGCERMGVTLTVCHDRRYDSEWMALKEIVDSDVLGDIFWWKLDHNQDVVIPQSSWAYWKDGIGGGCIMSCLTHQIDALRWYGGGVASVTCQSVTRPERMQGEFAGAVTAKMKSGALAQLSINWWTRSNTGKNSLWYEMVQVCGTKGEAYRLSGKGTFVRLHEQNDAAAQKYGSSVMEEFIQVESGAWTGHEGCIREWINLLQGAPNKVTTSGRECRATVEVAEAAYRSVEESRTIELPIQPTVWKESGMPPDVRGIGEEQSAKVVMGSR